MVFDYRKCSYTLTNLRLIMVFFTECDVHIKIPVSTDCRLFVLDAERKVTVQLQDLQWTYICTFRHNLAGVIQVVRLPNPPA
jgi:hypothetical protein